MDAERKSEKLTINVGALELAKMDLLVDGMEYANRSDFCRIAIRELLEKHREDIDRLRRQGEQSLSEENAPVLGGVGVIRLSNAWLDEVLKEGGKADIMVIGVLAVDKKVPASRLDAEIGKVKVYGKIQASPEVMAVLSEKKQEK